MLEIFLILTACVIVALTMIAYERTRDPICPAVVFAPMLLYVYAWHPYALLQNGQLEQLFPDLEALVPVVLYNLVGVACLFWGCAWELRPPLAVRRVSMPSRFDALMSAGLSWRARRRLWSVGVLLGVTAVATFWFLVWYSGGFLTVFGRGGKPFLNSPSGYIGELPTLVYPSLLLLATAIQRQRPRFEHVLLALCIASPQLIMASFGGKRGPAFLVLACLAVCWMIVRMKRPNLRMIVTGVCALGILVIFLGSNRRNLYLGVEERRVDVEAFASAVYGEEASTGNEFACGAATILATDHSGRHYFGVRYFALFFVRPIPRQIWPTKYEDLHLGWMSERPGSAGFSADEWIAAVGFRPAGGNAGGFLADLFLEFWWFGVLGAFLIGRVYSLVWKKWTRLGGIWMLIYFQMLGLSIYLPAQSVGAWGYRVLLFCVPTWLAWQRVAAKRARRQWRHAETDRNSRQPEEWIAAR